MLGEAEKCEMKNRPYLIYGLFFRNGNQFALHVVCKTLNQMKNDKTPGRVVDQLHDSFCELAMKSRSGDVLYHPLYKRHIVYSGDHVKYPTILVVVVSKTCIAEVAKFNIGISLTEFSTT